MRACGFCSVLRGAFRCSVLSEGVEARGHNQSTNQVKLVSYIHICGAWRESDYALRLVLLVTPPVKPPA